ncbi:hypothetical protein ACXHXG_31095 [Rhizobium sp. LEGMi198b]|uniref:hypothetical protein n=1 Tax=Rhizobium sp. CNPSo 3464 TaxID=3021406 RepID=UPI00254AA993|nr:hypothetical protein [Rhizobium sp. CNPSo 3464]MDK4741581.1 hypothetical protein [Rhizobium sp. CNPSo 3464]
MAVAINNAASAFHSLARQRVPDGFPTQEQLDDLNADFAKMTGRLANAISSLTDANWWLEHQEQLQNRAVYQFIVDQAERP